MATPKEVEAAIESTKKTQSHIGRSGTNFHKNGLTTCNATRNCLENPSCGACKNLTIWYFKRNDHAQAALGCTEGLTPLTPWIDWFPGDPKPTCKSFSQRVPNVVFEAES